MKRWLRYFRACIWPASGARQCMPKALSPSLEALESRRLLAVITVDTLADAALASSAGDGHISLREAIIDDCTLAGRIKARGGRTWLIICGS